MPKGICDKPSARGLFERVIVAVEKETGVVWVDLVATNRGTPEAATARGLAMAVAVAAGIPPFLVARMFQRCWATVDSARAEMLKRCIADDNERDRFIRILYQALGK